MKRSQLFAITLQSKSAIQIRNHEMVDRADLIICYIEHEKGGAWRTVKYAREQGKTVINLAEDTDRQEIR